MEKLFKKISLLLILCALIVPTTFVNAEDPDNTGSVSPTTEEKTEPTVKEEETKSNDATLGELRVEGIDLDKSFSKDDLEYKATVKSDVSSVNIIASLPEGSKASLDKSQLGIKNLNVGRNEFSIKVVAEDGKSELVYKIVVTRATDDLKLTKLNIKGQKLNESFDSETFEYTADVDNKVTYVDIQTGKPSGTKVVVSGNSNLKVGKNTITVTVKNDAGESKEYKIIVTRASEDETEEDDNTTSTETVSSVTSDLVTSDSSVVSDVVSDTKDDDSDKGSNNSLRSIIIVTSSILLLLIAGLGIYFYVRSGDSEKRRNKKIDKLKRKQAKIEEQLTGLMPVITEEQEKEYLSKNSKDEKEETVEEVSEEIEEETEDQEYEEDDTVTYYEEEFETTIEIEPEVINATRRKRVDKTIFDDDFDDLFDDRDE